MYIERSAETLVRSYSDHFKVIAVTGPRQVGKTTMLMHLAQQDAERGIERAYVSLDDVSLQMLAKDDPALFLQRFKPPIIIDEIQKAPELLPYIKHAVDGSSRNGLFWLAGSQPLHLMRGLSESLAGRVGIIELLGLSNAELAGKPNVPFDPTQEYFLARSEQMTSFGVTEAYRRIIAGSLPGIQSLPDDLRRGAYESYIDTYVMRDIHDLSQVTDELKFRRFMAACASLTSKPVVYAQLARVADVDEKTAKAWTSLLVSSYLVKIVQPYSNNLLKRLSKQPIMHFTDTGLAAHLAGWYSAEALSVGALSGQVFETFVFDEILKSHVNAGLQPQLSFFRNNDKKEIDLLLECDGRMHPIEVKLSASPRRSDTKNFGALGPLAADDVPAELVAFKREIGMGAVVCMSESAYPLSENAWAFPAWAI
ncbi:MAG: ATP-binding protein [Coriobacteriales bacterium]|nr:ATP-binding protein [Coriobacteriales bacterium]